MINFLIFFVCTLALIFIILFGTYFINIPSNDYEKHSAYECGFEPFGDARSFFDIHFYTIGLLFIVFDLEVVFLIPFVVDISSLSLWGYLNLIFFLVIVLFGFYYEWAVGLLNWLPSKKYTASAQIINFSILVNNDFIDLFKLTIFYVDPNFLIFTILISLSLLLNCINNLVYKVINLGALSIIVVGNWIYFTDMTFLYIVYILAFVGAVLMLFLSVVLMLPSSIMLNKNNYNMTSPILVSTELVNTEVGVMYILIFIFSWLLIYCITTWFSFRFYGLCTEYATGLESYRNSISLKHLFGFDLPIEVIAYFGKSDLNLLKMPPQYWVILVWHDFLYYIFQNVESRLYTSYRPNFKYDLIAPVWGSLHILFDNPCRAARDIKHASAITQEIKTCYIPLQTKFSLFTILPVVKKIRLILYVIGESTTINYVNKGIFLVNLIFFLSFQIIFKMWTFLLQIPGFFWNRLEQIKQTFFFSCILFSCLPSVFQKPNSLYLLDPEVIINNKEGLLAIKELMYETNSLFLIISVTVLLVALIGSSVFTRQQNK